VFHLDLDGRRSDKPVAAALRAAKSVTTMVQVLGTYPRALPAAVPPPRRRRRAKPS
jgi:prephenate dehydratase